MQEAVNTSKQRKLKTSLLLSTNGKNAFGIPFKLDYEPKSEDESDVKVSQVAKFLWNSNGHFDVQVVGPMENFKALKPPVVYKVVTVVVSSLDHSVIRIFEIETVINSRSDLV